MSRSEFDAAADGGVWVRLNDGGWGIELRPSSQIGTLCPGRCVVVTYPDGTWCSNTLGELIRDSGDVVLYRALGWPLRPELVTRRARR